MTASLHPRASGARVIGVAALALASALGGCVHTLRPVAVSGVPVSPSRQSFEPGARVRLVNERAGAERVTVLRACCHRYEVDPAEWTREFVAALEAELERRGVAVDESGTEVRVAVDLGPVEGNDGLPRLEVGVTAGAVRRVYPRAASDKASLKETFFRAMEDLLEDDELRRAMAAAGGG